MVDQAEDKIYVIFESTGKKNVEIHFKDCQF